ncbi:MAG: sulfatase [Akkermansiaceae bacterium]
MNFKNMLLAVGCAFVGSVTHVDAKEKNVLFLFADDLGYKDLGCYGSSFYETPNLDALAKDAVQFTNAYAACPVCSPTRSSLMTGQYPARTKNTDYFGAFNPKPGQATPKWKKPLVPASYVNHLPHELTTLPEALKAQGYATFFAGKWHLGGEGSLPTDHGFDINKGGWKQGGPYGGKKYFSPYGNPQLEDGEDGEHLPDRLATETVKFMKETDKPFFALLSFYSVHTPLIGREDLVKKYEAKAEKLGAKEDEIFEEEFPRKVRAIQQHAIYGAMVEAMDEAVGKVIQGLKDSGKYDDTVVIFFSDNGGLSTSEGSPTSNYPLRAGKGWTYEGGIREPLLLRVPGVTEAGSKSDLLVTSTDFFPTILEACGKELQVDDHLDGVSILEQMKAKDDDRVLFWHYPHWGNQGGIPSSAVRVGDWKLIKFYYSKGVELYNLKDDPAEKVNLVEKEMEKTEVLLKVLQEKLDATKATLPTKNESFVPKKNYRW